MIAKAIATGILLTINALSAKTPVEEEIYKELSNYQFCAGESLTDATIFEAIEFSEVDLTLMIP